MAEDKIENLAYNPDSYGSGQVLGADALNNDNASEQNSINNTLGLIGDLYGDQFSALFINSLGRAVGSAARLMPLLPDMPTINWATLYNTHGEKKYFSVGQIDYKDHAVTSFELDFVPTSMTSVSNGVTTYTPAASRNELITGTYYLDGKLLSFYDNLQGKTITVKYTPNLYSNVALFNPKAGLNIIPNLADVSAGSACTIGLNTGQYYIEMPSVMNYVLDFANSSSEVTKRIGSTSTSIGVTSLDDSALISNSSLIYGLPKFFLEENLSIGGFDATIPTNAVTIYAINNGTIVSKVEHDFEFTIGTISGRNVLFVSSPSNLDQTWNVSGFQFAIALSSGYALTHAISTIAQALSLQDHGANGGKAVSIKNVKDLRPSGMGMTNLNDDTVPMNHMPQYLHKGGFKASLTSINGNAFSGDLRIASASNTTNLLDFNTQRSTEWEDIVDDNSWDAKVNAVGGKLSLANGSSLKFAMFGNSGEFNFNNINNYWDESSINYFGAKASAAAALNDYPNERWYTVNPSDPSYGASDWGFHAEKYLSDRGVLTTLVRRGYEVNSQDGVFNFNKAHYVSLDTDWVSAINMGTNLLDADHQKDEADNTTMAWGVKYAGGVFEKAFISGGAGLAGLTDKSAVPTNNGYAQINFMKSGSLHAIELVPEQGWTSKSSLVITTFNPGGGTREPGFYPIRKGVAHSDKGFYFDGRFEGEERWQFNKDVRVLGTLIYPDGVSTPGNAIPIEINSSVDAQTRIVSAAQNVPTGKTPIGVVYRGSGNLICSLRITTDGLGNLQFAVIAFNASTSGSLAGPHNFTAIFL